MNTVYDTTVVAYSNGDLAGRRPNTAMDRRLRLLEECLRGKRTPWYNRKLLGEYNKHIKLCRNDVIEAFLRVLGDRGRRATRDTLSRQMHARARRAGWPSHDQHLLAAAVEAGDATIVVTEVALGVCSQRIRRVFRVAVLQV
jgi:hypothetical protein